jgi:hypothetical protein
MFTTLSTLYLCNTNVFCWSHRMIKTSNGCLGGTGKLGWVADRLQLASPQCPKHDFIATPSARWISTSVPKQPVRCIQRLITDSSVELCSDSGDICTCTKYMRVTPAPHDCLVQLVVQIVAPDWSSTSKIPNPRKVFPSSWNGSSSPTVALLGSVMGLPIGRAYYLQAATAQGRSLNYFTAQVKTYSASLLCIDC